MDTHYFFALTLPDEIKTQLHSQFNPLKYSVPFKKWLHPADYHITMAFLGNASDAMREEALKLVQTELESEKKFELILDGIGIFGRQEQPRILWVDVKKNQALFDIQQKVYQACTEAGFSLDKKPFKPHITIARKYHSETAFSLQTASELMAFEQKKFLASQITLYQTHIGRSPSYEPIHSIILH